MAFIVLQDGVVETVALKDEIKAQVKSKLAAYEAPREIRVTASLPMTTTGKIIRAELRRL